ERMGDKVASRKLAIETGVPLLPGVGPVESATEVLRFADEHGYPVALKAAAGGGGRGLRVAHSPDEVDASLETARREGALYFGNPTVYAERFLNDPKHVEIQVMGDALGDIIALGERDCSVQRRHQKLIEESPGPTVAPDLRERMETAALRLAEAVMYSGAGTVEFLVEPGGGFYFLEMNTRIQVEHPVTELVRGCDLVAMQLLAAAGEPADPPGEARGHAIECRINAEDAAAGFRPSPGRITLLREPSGPGVRVDSGVREGYTLPAEYDSLAAKLIVWGRDREEARVRMLRALNEYRFEGPPTTIELHKRILAHPEFVAGTVDTAFLEREAPALLADLAVHPVGLASSDPERRTQARSVIVEVNDRRFAVRVYDDHAAGVAAPESRKPGLAVRPSRSSSGDATLLSPLQGAVLSVHVEPGQSVSRGDLVCVIEAMKMENEIQAHKDGAVSAVHVQAGLPVALGAPIVEIG
ncbi:MAG: biotin/lipoyl-containing protein, partial [Chloroflexia bacterium]